MQQILNMWTGLDARRKAIVVLATVAVFATVISLGRAVTKPGMALLYSGLESGAAGDVVRALEQRGAVYEVRGGAIYVESASRDELRMTLASEGLPANTTQGYELLDSLSGFGTTSQMFDAAYWRAKEGELARTIVVSPLINQARVHIANASSNPFQRHIKPSASVTITTASGDLPTKHAQALRFLVASAVAGLSPEDVAVIDGSGGLVGIAEETTTTVGEDREEATRTAVQRLLEARVGPGNAVVEVSIETVTETESITERIFDPASRVAISTDTEERSTDSQNASGTVTVASNLPDGDAAGESGSTNQNRETRERINYEVSETQREILREPGAVRRMTVAVLVNGTPAENELGEAILEPRSEEEMEALRELVASAVGFDESRGDVITLKSMNFQPLVPMGTSAESSMFQGMTLDLMSIIQTAVLAIVALVLGLFVVRPLLAGGSGELNDMAEAPMLPGLDDGDGFPAMAPMMGEVDDGGMMGMPMALGDMGGDAGDLPALGGGMPMGDDGMSQSDAAERLRNLIADRKEETVEILRHWLDDREERV
ncbi:flagellar M-ring protein FliF [Shimia sp. R11_0]|uniref:Flagellar M-ring protein n=1 Tax=Shimia marina TaxID=321267 RepID=A0A0P1FAB3_9RHOB|nr:flagellar basal-body MS-ring/collar protein FliF [Shimia marina]MBO9476291.1 flagellar M-ring protein FliF [Shimia sp. R11_0]CUH51347.1 Flagellar M-ring protein [Shimia marina]SFD51424.1 flagellar M-ring protein FliF [Shimia marina]